MILTSGQLTTLRSKPHGTKLWLSIYQPPTLLACLVNDVSISKGETAITFDTVSSGAYTDVDADVTMMIGTSAGKDDVGRIRVRSITSSVITVAENTIDWKDNLFLTVIQYIDINAIYPRIIQDPADDENVIFYKDDDIAYTNQNSVLGSFVNMGSHRAAFLEGGVAQIYYCATGTYNVNGEALTYLWDFGGGTPTGSVSYEPGYVSYNTTGHKRTKLTVTNASGGTDVSYRYVSIYDRPENGTSTPILNWEFDNLSGSRSEGGYTLSLQVRENIDQIQPNALIVIFADDVYGSTDISLGGNQLNNEKIVFVGYILGDTINYDYNTSTVEFSAGSITDMMKQAEGFSVSCESKASPTTWFEIQEMTVAKAVYHYLRWHSTVLKVSDFQYTGTDKTVQYFDSERTSLFTAVDGFVRGGLLGELVSDRQGKLWAEITPPGTDNPLSRGVSMSILKQDWVGTPSIREARSEELSFVEMGGIAYSGASTGTFSALISNAPTQSPLYRGKVEKIEGFILTGQSQLNSMAGHYLATKNSKFPEIGLSIAGNYRNLDIAPIEFVKPFIAPEDTYRNTRIQDEYYNIERMDWSYDASLGAFSPEITLIHVATGTAGVTIDIPDVPDDSGFNVPGIQIPSIPPLTFPSFASNGSSPTGSSCCDYFADLGVGEGMYSVVLMRSTATPYPNGYNDPPVGFGFDYASNPYMYEPSTGNIPLINTGTISYGWELSAHYIVNAVQFSFESITIGFSLDGNGTSIALYLYDSRYAGALGVNSYKAGGGVGYEGAVATAGVIHISVLPTFIYPAKLHANMSSTTLSPGFDVQFTNLRLHLIGTP